jgi:hypothetical protein
LNAESDEAPETEAAQDIVDGGDATAPVPEPVNSKLEASLLPELLHDAGMPADVEIPHAAASV